MNGPNRDADQREFLDRPPAVFVEYATIGWDGQDDVLDQGTSGQDDDDGPSFVRITLYRGKPIGVKVQHGVAQGSKVIAHLLGPIFYVPPKNQRVLIAWPDGESGVPVILGTVGFSPTAQFKRDRVVIDFGPDHDVVMKGRTLMLADHDGAGTGFPTWLAVGPLGGGVPGIYASDPAGAGFNCAGGNFGAWAVKLTVRLRPESFLMVS